MCGIFGYVGNRDAVPLILEGLKILEYRGYDSAGIVGIRDGKALFRKGRGKVGHLAELIRKKQMRMSNGIAHTRWATHGKVNQLNAHPHFDDRKSMALVHNGIIENYRELQQRLANKNIHCITETDSEVIVQMIASVYKGDLLRALQIVLPGLEGAFAIAGVHVDHENEIFLAAKEAPLAIGVGEGEYFISSDVNGFIKYTRKVIFLKDGEMALVSKDRLQIWDRDGNEVIKEIVSLKGEIHEISKRHFEHYTLKEIYDQPEAVRRLLVSRFDEEFGAVCLKDMGIDGETFLQTSGILILACGSSWHAGFIGSYLFEALSRIPVRVEISSEYRYKNPIVLKNTLVIAISQSGETSDTLAAVHELKAKGAKVIAVCNREESMLGRITDHTLLIKAGPEIGVCSTKAFTNQVLLLSLLALHLGRMHHLSKESALHFIRELKQLPEKIQQVLQQAPAIEKMAEKYASYEHFFYLGRSYMYPTCMEAALKLKEISYVSAQGYPAGEIKHGPIALIDSNYPTVALCCNRHTYSKSLANLMEIKLRGGPIAAFAMRGSVGLEEITEDVFYLPEICDELAPMTTSVALQLFAYYVAKKRGCDIDQPRNLAKSVTVE